MVNPGFLATSHHGINDGCVFGSAIVATEQPVLSAMLTGLVAYRCNVPFTNAHPCKIIIGLGPP